MSPSPLCGQMVARGLKPHFSHWFCQLSCSTYPPWSPMVAHASPDASRCLPGASQMPPDVQDTVWVRSLGSWDSTLSVPAFGVTFWRFLAILDSMWSPWGTILAPRDAFLGDHFWCRFLDPKKRPKKRVYADFVRLYADIGELCAEVRRNVRSRSGGLGG